MFPRLPAWAGVRAGHAPSAGIRASPGQSEHDTALAQVIGSGWARDWPRKLLPGAAASANEFSQLC